jgi:hypothetical protein
VCAGCIDGLFIKIIPRTTNRYVIKNKTRFYSASKKNHGINMQGVCDANNLFQIISCRHTGSTNDVVAFETSSLKDCNESLPSPYHWNGDGAYTSTETMVVPFPGINLAVTDLAKESFNFFQSQIRILIECTFGIFIARWGIFWKPLKFRLPLICKIIHCCVRLHNFCTRERIRVISTKYFKPLIACTNSKGVLISPKWRVSNTEPRAIQTISTGNTIANRILTTIRVKKYFMNRNKK